MSDAHFTVATRLTRLLGEGYRSSEAALKELVDNAWDADAQNVWITLPEPFSGDPVIVRDDGSGMTPLELRREYLNIASDKRARTGERTPHLKRKVKGRKGIGKFAGLTVASQMQVEAVSRGLRSTLLIDKEQLIANQADLEAVPLPFEEAAAAGAASGTTITLSLLDQRLNFPSAARLRQVLIYEYGREEGFKVHVNSTPLSVEDVPGTTTELTTELDEGGSAALRFTVADGKKTPSAPGIVLKVNGKAVGKPHFFGLDEDEEIPAKLLRRVYGEVEVQGLEDYVTADWGGVLDNSITYQAASAYIRAQVKNVLKIEHAREMSLQRARLKLQIQARLQQLPENRRAYAENALSRILQRFYGETPDRISVIAEVALDAMEHDAYWAVLEKIQAAGEGDVAGLAASLEQFGLVELGNIGAQARHRLQFLDALEKLITNPATLERDVHQAIEKNLWILGRQFSLLSSNVTLRRMVDQYCAGSFTGAGSNKRPDLLLSQAFGDHYLLIEFKRPAHIITRMDVSQAENYRDQLTSQLKTGTRMDIVLIGKARDPVLTDDNLAKGIVVHSFASIISAARSELDWILSSLSSEALPV